MFFILLRLEHCNSPFTSLECLQISHSVFLVTLMSHIANANSVTLDPQWTSEFTFRFWFWHLELCMDRILIRGLRTSDQGLLAVHHTRLKTKGDRAFVTVASKLWNSLPLSLRSVHSVVSFKKLLKTQLCRLAFSRLFFCFYALVVCCEALWDLCLERSYK